MIAIDALSRTEKLQVMEALWEDLTRGAEPFATPPWHEAALRETEQAHASGQATFVSLAEAKQQLSDRHR